MLRVLIEVLKLISLSVKIRLLSESFLVVKPMGMRKQVLVIHLFICICLIYVQLYRVEEDFSTTICNRNIIFQLNLVYRMSANLS